MKSVTTVTTKRKVLFVFSQLMLALFALPLLAMAQNATTAGTPTSPFPTIENLSINWPIAGDDNENGTVAVRYRDGVLNQWIDAAPLIRIPAGSNTGFNWPNHHAGSLMGLEANTNYDIELTLTDPDGGDTTQIITATTRGWPVSSTTGTLVTPATIGAALASLSPGTTLILADGNYGPLNIFAFGTEANPIVIRAQNTHGAIVQGDVRMDTFANIHIVGLSVEGQIKFNNSSNIVIRECLITTDRDGVVSYGNGVTNALIMDNTIIGPTVWNEAALGNNGNNLGEGIVLTGPGNVIAFNRVEGFRDGISLVEDSGAVNQQSIDIYGNDIYRCADDGIEADFSMGNVRVYQNRLTDCFMGISSQPSLGGPTYMVRNVIYNAVHQAFKLQRSSVGDIGIHNTVVKSGDAFNVITGDVWSRAYFRNNIFIGGPAGTYNGFNNGAGRILYLPSSDSTCDFNFDGYGSIGTGGAFIGQIESTSFNGLAQLQSMTTETNSVQLDLSVFAAPVVVPADPTAEHNAPDYSLAPQSAAVDVGIALTGFNDGFTGVAPDLGAYELDKTLPTYGPGGSLGGDDPPIVGRFTFYNNSDFDGDNASANADDVLAIATDKQPLLSGQTASFENYTSFSKGLNGVMFEIHGASPTISQDDFEFRVGTDNNFAAWPIAPAPTSITFTAGSGDEPDRVTIIWADAAMTNTWLQVTMLATPDTGLSTNDICYFGNIVGETGNSTTNAIVNLVDVGRVRGNQTGFGTAPIDNLYDVNRDGRVNLIDVGITRGNQSGFGSVPLITP